MSTQIRELGVEQFIALAAKSASDKATRQEVERQKNLRFVKEGMRAALGTLWTELEPYAKETAALNDGNNIVFDVEAAPLRLAGFQITAKRVSKGALGEEFVTVSLSAHNCNSADATRADEVALFLSKRRTLFGDIERQERRRDYDILHNQLVGCGYNEQERASSLLAQMIELAPDRAKESRELFANWQSQAEERHERAIEREREQAARAEAEKAYRAAYAQYLSECQRVDAANAETLVVLQAEYNQPMTVFLLEYGILANNEYEESQVETRTVYVAWNEPRKDGYWTVYEHGRITLKRFFHPVSVSAAIETSPAEKLVSRAHYIGGRNILTHPSVESVSVELIPEPQRPARPENLDPYHIERIECEVRNGKSYSEMGF